MDQGLLVPDELTCDLVTDRIQQEDCAKGFILDGFPRTIPQAEALDKALTGMHTQMDFAIDVDVKDGELTFTPGTGEIPAPRKRDSIAHEAESLLPQFDLSHAGAPSHGGGVSSDGAAD